MPEPQDVVPKPYADTAWSYRQAGWPGVIQVGQRPARKSPPPTGYTGWCGKDPSGADIQAWIDGPEGAHNIALHLQPDVYVLDVDVYGEKDGAAALGIALPATWTSTARGADSPSRQHFFRARLPEGRMWLDHPAPGTESLHTGHRYAVVWPSINPDAGGERYHWYDPTGELYEGVPAPDELTPLPAELIEAFSKPGVPMDGTATGADEAHNVIQLFRDAPACRRVQTTLRRELDRLATPETGRSIHDPGKLHPLVCYGLEGHGGVREALALHHDRYAAARVTERGESHAFASADWWRQVRGSIGKKLAASGGAVLAMCDCIEQLGELVNDPVPAEVEVDGVAPDASTSAGATVTAVDALLAEMLTPEVIAERPSPEFLIEGLLNLDSEAWIIGEPGCKKSFVALDMALRVACGERWQGRDTCRSDVVMIAAEGAGGLTLRMRAWRKRHHALPDNVHILPRPVRARDGEAWEVLVEACRRLRPGLVIIDTQSRVAVGLEENSATEMMIYVAAVTAIKRATGACVLSIHHTGRNGGDARGSSAIDGAQDTELKVEKVTEFAGKLTSHKQKDLELAPEIPLVFEQVDLGLNERGKAISSLVLASDSDPFLIASRTATELDPAGSVRIHEPQPWTHELVSGTAGVDIIRRQLLQTLHDLAGEHEGLTRAELKKSMEERWYAERSASGRTRKGIDTQTWNQAWTGVEKLVHQGEVVMVSGGGGRKLLNPEAIPHQDR